MNERVPFFEGMENTVIPGDPEILEEYDYPDEEANDTIPEPVDDEGVYYDDLIEDCILECSDEWPEPDERNCPPEIPEPVDNYPDFGPDDDPEEYFARRFALPQPNYHASASPAYARAAYPQPVNVTVNIPICSPQPVRIRGCNGYCLSCPYRQVCGEVI